MQASDATGQGIGQPVRRKEDFRLLTGQGRYGDDLVLANMAHAVFVRSPHAHARIVAIDTAAARAAPGVLAVLTGADYLAAGLAPIPHAVGLMNKPDVQVRLRAKPVATAHYPLPADKVRFAGEGIVLVVAETLDQARNAADLVVVDYDPLPAIVQAADAVRPDAPGLWPQAPGNICVDLEVGDQAATSAAFATAAHVVRLETWAQRVTGVPMEPRTIAASYEDGLYTIYTGSGRGVSKVQTDLAMILGVSADQVRCVCEDMGGNFGTRNFFYPEYALLPWASRVLGRPVKWKCERIESFLSDFQGRDLTVEAELALDANGRFLAVRGTNLSNLGSHSLSFVSLQKGIGLMSGVYNIPAAWFRGLGAITNTVPTTPYRSAGRPEIIFVLERLVDLAADRLGIDPAELRRRNLVPRAAHPYTNPLGVTYDSGDYPAVMEDALRLGRWTDFPGRRADARKRGKYRGIGIGNYVEITSGTPRERAEIVVLPQGRIELVMGTMSSGQGHETSFAQLVAEWLGVPLECIDYIAHDTARVKAGGGSHSGRSMKLATSVIGQATDDIIAKGRAIAAVLLQVSPDALTFQNGQFTVSGTGRTIGLFDVAAPREDLPDALRGPLAAISDQTLPVASFPYGTHVCEVEVDPETGAVEITGYVAVDDVGRAVNPLILHGQTHGGIAQGVGQALMENSYYDKGTGQLLAASFMDYAMPRAGTFPSMITALSEVPSPTNRLGVRSGGEGGTTGALAAVVNAIVDALSEIGVTHIEMPATPERVWRAIQAARAG